MKRNLALGLALSTLVFGGAGLALRRWQIDTAFEAVSGLLTPGKPATAALIAALAVGAVTVALLAWRMFRGEAPRGYLANLAAPNMGVGILTLLAGALLFAGGVLGIRDYVLHMDERIIRLVLGLCLVPGGVCVGLVGLLGQQRQEGKGRFHGALLAPGYCACVWLVAAYQAHTANPNVMEYVFLLLGILCVIFACYTAASFSFEKPRPFLCALFSALGVILLLTTAADRLWGMDLMVCWGFALYLYVQLICLVCCRVRPPQLQAWTPPLPEETGEEAEEKTETETETETERKDQPRGEEDE